MKKYVVSYEIDYVHRVSVGVTAESENAAGAKARAAFDEGRIWGDTDRMPLLYDEYEEVTDDTLRWMPVQEVAEFPPRDSSVISERGKSMALAACRALADAYRTGEEHGGSIDWSHLDDAHALALEAIRLYDNPGGEARLRAADEVTPVLDLETGVLSSSSGETPEGLRTERMCVAGYNPKGDADLLPMSVEMTEEQWALGEHLSAAEALAEKAGWEGPFVVFSSDETVNLRRASTNWERKPRLAILVKDGFVDRIVTDGSAEHPFLSEIDVAIVDYDVEGSDPEEYLVEVPQASGYPKKARVSFVPVLESKIPLDSVFRRIGG